MENNVRYIIPKRLVKNSTIFEGIGLKEVGVVAVGVVLGIVLFFVSGAFISNLILKMIFLLIPIGITIGLVIPLNYGENSIVMMKRGKVYNKSQQVFYYVRGTR